MKNQFIVGLVAAALLMGCQAILDGSPPSPNKEETMADEPPTPTPAVQLPDLGPAPEIDNDIWINSEPLSMADLRGKVVLVEFWTFG